MKPPHAANPPLGAYWDGDGVWFSVRSAHASAVELCLFDAADNAVECRLPLKRLAGDLWRVRVPNLGPGQLYGYRVDGPRAPQSGHRFNPAKLLIDPWARAITGEPKPDPALFGYVPGEHVDLSWNGRDSAPYMPRSVVIDPAFDWGDDRPPRVPWRETVIYEAHVRGLTMRHPEVDPALRGTYLGLVSPPVIEHLLALGITAVELLPVQQIAREPHLWSLGLANYWGYSTLGFFAPHAGYATGVRGEQVEEFKIMVRELHRAGIEVILDVVYNHTAEGGHGGPVYSMRGFDNRSFYRLAKRNKRRYVNWSGCGNVLDFSRKAVREFVLDSLRFWVEEMRVDGFRFDIAPVLGRIEQHFDPRSAFFRELAQDPALRGVKLIAEPWDLGPHGYHLGAFPDGWAEWNDRFRDGVKSFWRGDHGSAEGFRKRLLGSPDVYPERGPLASVNFVACHDGYTLRDLVSYEGKHNEANGEGNRDGHNHNLSRNWGIEGPSDDPTIRAVRRRVRRSLLATVFLSPGVPMLLYGDELGRSQGGNNNAYCQDNEISWIDWAKGDEDPLFLAFVRRLALLRRRFRELAPAAVPRQRCFFFSDGDATQGDVPPAFMMRIPAVPEEGHLLLMINGTSDNLSFKPPSGDEADVVELLAAAREELDERPIEPPFVVASHSLTLVHSRPRARRPAQCDTQ